MDANTLAEHAHVVCPHCDTVNRVATGRSEQAWAMMRKADSEPFWSVPSEA